MRGFQTRSRSGICYNMESVSLPCLMDLSRNHLCRAERPRSTG